jgi:hypothetical protein
MKEIEGQKWKKEKKKANKEKDKKATIKRMSTMLIWKQNKNKWKLMKLKKIIQKNSKQKNTNHKKNRS